LFSQAERGANQSKRHHENTKRQGEEAMQSKAELKEVIQKVV
jgi:hypothetical protein